MFELSGKIQGLSQELISRQVTLTLSINEEATAKALYDDLHDAEKLSIKIDKYRKKRSLDANALLWKACSAIADSLRTSKDEVYLDMLKRYGQTFVCKIPNKHIEVFKKQNKYVEQHESLPPEENAQYFRVWVGSSNYDSREMSVLIDGVLSEIREMRIPFMSPDEISLYMSEQAR